MDQPLIEHTTSEQQTKGAERERQILEQLLETSAALLGERNPQEVLETICRAAFDLFDVDHSGLVLFEQPNRQRGRVVAEYPNLGTRGVEIPVLGIPDEERLIETQDSLVIDDVAIRASSLGPVLEIFRRFDIRSTLIVPVVSHGHVLGSFSLDAIGRLRTFTKEEADLCKIFAAQAAAAVENANLLTEITEQKDYLARLIASSPNGVIAIDLHGSVTGFNARAEEILKYRAEEVRGKRVDLLYADQQEPRRIGDLLHASPEGKLANHETVIRSKEGDHIPIRLAATWLYDTQGRQIGSVGYFEDLRLIKETERRLELLLKASNIVAQAENLTDGLYSLAEMMVLFLNTSLCRIFLLDERRQFLVAEAEHLMPRAHGALDPGGGIGGQIDIVEWPELTRLLVEGRPRMFTAGADPASRSALDEWSRLLHLQPALQSLLALPLRAGDRPVGLLALGELRRWERAPFSSEKQELAVAIADQTAILIDRLRLHEITDRRRRLLAALDDALRYIRSEIETTKLLQQIVRMAASLLGCPAAGLLIYRPHLAELEVIAVSGLPDTLLGARQSNTEGLIGLVARIGRPHIIHGYADWPGCDRFLAPYRFQDVVAAPLRRDGAVSEVLFVADRTGACRLSEIDLETLDSFAAHAAQSLHTARLMSREQRMFGQLNTLHHISDYIQAAGDLGKILHVVLTGITAGYGLGFNRAALLLLDKQREYLVGRMGIGHLDEAEAQEDWAQHQRRGMEDFGQYLEILERDHLPLTPIGEHILTVRVPVRSPEAEAFWRALSERQYTLKTQEELEQLPASFIAAFEPALPLIVAPLLAREQVIGFIVADNKFTRSPITRDDIDSLLTFANTAALVIDNTQLYNEAHASQSRLRAFWEASNALVLSHDPEYILQETVERAQAAADASGVSVVLIDETGRARNLITAGMDRPTNIVDIIRPDGLSMQVMHTGAPEIIPDIEKDRDWVNPSLFERGIRAALCLPISLKGQRIGVMWFHYNQPRYFSDAEIEAIQLYVNQAALAYDGARRIEALSKARNAARVVAHVTALGDLQSTLRSVVEGTRSALNCDAITLYMYDKARDHLSHPPIMTGVWNEEGASRFSEVAKTSIVAMMLLHDQMRIVHTIADDPQFSKTRFAREEQIASCVAIPLKVGQETVGVMFVNYRTPHRFTADELTNIELFANQAAVAIRNAQLYEEMQRRLREQALLREVALAASSSPQLDRVLQAVANRIAELLGYESVGIHLVDPLTQDLSGPCYYAGGWTRIMNTSKARGITGRVIRTRIAALVPDVRKDPDYVLGAQDTRSEMCVPLCVDTRVAGAINVESARVNAFTEHDLQLMETIAGQVVNWIENARLYTELEKTQEMLAARTALAWMGMLSSTWRHTIVNNATTIRDLVILTRKDLDRGATTEKLLERLNDIDMLARKIGDTPITAPLSVEEEAVSVSINELLRERIAQLWQNEPYASVHMQLTLNLNDATSVRTSPDWLRRAFDILIDNAVHGMAEAANKRMTVQTGPLNDGVEILFIDTGRGIPEDIRPRLFRQTIQKPRGAKGMGMGLLLAQLIVHMHGGEIGLQATSSKGTTFRIWLPIEA